MIGVDSIFILRLIDSGVFLDKLKQLLDELQNEALLFTG